MQEVSNKKGNWLALLPIAVFLIVYKGIIPYGAQMVTAVSLTGAQAGAIIPYLFYPYLLAISALAFMLIPSLIKKK